MHFLRTSRLALVVMIAAIVACNSGNGFSDAGTDGGKAIGDNPNVTAACQTCVNQSSGNDCASQQKNCVDDSICSTLNTCVNKCANINSGCINNCGMAASANAISGWTSWYNCVCADCGAQCNSTFCGMLTSADSGSDAATCLGSGAACSTDQQCCVAAPFCDNSACATCVSSDNPCDLDEQCCSTSCDQNTGTCF